MSWRNDIFIIHSLSPRADTIYIHFQVEIDRKKMREIKYNI